MIQDGSPEMSARLKVHDVRTEMSATSARSTSGAWGAQSLSEGIGGWCHCSSLDSTPVTVRARGARAVSQLYDRHGRAPPDPHLCAAQAQNARDRRHRRAFHARPHVRRDFARHVARCEVHSWLRQLVFYPERDDYVLVGARGASSRGRRLLRANGQVAGIKQ